MGEEYFYFILALESTNKTVELNSAIVIPINDYYIADQIYLLQPAEQLWRV